jgi:hypothetical protein
MRPLWQRTGRISAVVFAGLVGVAAMVAPESTNVTSNVDDIEWRKLDVPTTTTTSKTTSTTTVAPRPVTNGDDWFMVIDGNRAYKIPKSPMTAQLLWLATAIEVE